jgi:hypothetical protein
LSNDCAPISVLFAARRRDVHAGADFRRPAEAPSVLPRAPPVRPFGRARCASRRQDRATATRRRCTNDEIENRGAVPDFHGDCTLVLKDGTRLTLSRTYRAKVEGALGRRLSRYRMNPGEFVSW